MNTRLRQFHTGAVRDLLQLVTHCHQGFVLAAHIFHGIQKQSAQTAGHAGAGKGSHQLLHFGGHVLPVAPGRCLLGQLELTAQSRKLLADQIHHFTAGEVLALWDFALHQRQGLGWRGCFG